MNSLFYFACTCCFGSLIKFSTFALIILFPIMLSVGEQADVSLATGQGQSTMAPEVTLDSRKLISYGSPV